MQVDGEPCRLLPSIIRLQLRNQANMIAKAKTHTQPAHIPTLEKIPLTVRKLSLSDYETYHYDKDRLKEVSTPLGVLPVKPDLELDHVRNQINHMVQSREKFVSQESDVDSLRADDFKRYRIENSQALSTDWCFVDSCTAERFFRIDRAQEHLHYVVDICNDDLFVLDAVDDNYRDEGMASCLLTEPEGKLDIASRVSDVSSTGEDNNNSIIIATLHGIGSGSGAMGSADDNGGAATDEETTKKSSSHYAVEESGQRGSSSNDGQPCVSSEHGELEAEFLQAARAGELQALKLLHEHGSRLETAEANGMTALHYAARYGYENMVQFLIQESPGLMELRDNEGQTALHEAAKCRRQRICGMLAVAGCSLDKADNHGLTAKELALNAGDVHLSAYLDHFERYQNTLKDKETTL
ncbi:Eye-specific diacylglycerol kinase [Halotydeus destructor]|nr:Eye-specific diacylglycerol kinase [Halotydeus destructor]